MTDLSLHKINSKLSEKVKVEKRREVVERFCKREFRVIGDFSIDPKLVVNKSCENMIGAVQIPLGIAGPLKLQVTRGKWQDYLVPLATTEGALAASVNRGCKATRLSGGINVLIEDIGVTRGPVFEVENLDKGMKTVSFIEQNWEILAQIVGKQEKHLRLKDFSWQVLGKNLYLRFIFDTSEAMGMNMASIATKRIADFLSKKLGIRLVSLSGNFCVDKKPAWLNFIEGRGKKVWAEAVIKKEIVKKVLKTGSEKIVEVVNKKCLLGSAISGSLGFNAHFANIISALFLATGQDMAHVVEGSLGMTTAEKEENGDLYFSVYLPSLMVGTVGGGTDLPTQKEALSILGLGKAKKGEALEFANIISAAVLAGELSLVAALAGDDLVSAHRKLGRGGR